MNISAQGCYFLCVREWVLLPSQAVLLLHVEDIPRKQCKDGENILHHRRQGKRKMDAAGQPRGCSFTSISSSPVDVHSRVQQSVLGFPQALYLVTQAASEEG